MKPNGRLSELARVAQNGCELTYADTGFIPPNIWLSSALIRDFLDRGLIERKEGGAVITERGKKVLRDSLPIRI